MPKFNFNTFSTQNILNQLLDTIPATVNNYNFLIIGDTIILPLGVAPKNTYSAKTLKKDLATTEQDTSLTSFQAQDGGTVITQRTGDQIRISSSVTIELFNKLFNFTGGIVTVPTAGVIDSAFEFAYTYFQTTNCILIDSTGVRGAGDTPLRISDWNRSLDSKNPDKVLLDIVLSFEKDNPTAQTSGNQSYSISEKDVNDILLS